MARKTQRGPNRRKGVSGKQRQDSERPKHLRHSSKGRSKIPAPVEIDATIWSVQCQGKNLDVLVAPGTSVPGDSKRGDALSTATLQPAGPDLRTPYDHAYRRSCRLTENQAKTWYLLVVEGSEYKDVAKLLNKSLSTIGNTVLAIRRKIQTVIGQQPERVTNLRLHFLLQLHLGAEAPNPTV